jgi:asparagine synthase (glutamine-hydrolysing)
MLATNQLIGQAFKDTMIAAEKPQLRTGPVPLYLLSKTVRKAGLKVVLTGEGADEFFGGYDIFRETKLRRGLSRFPHSQRRLSLIGRLHPYIFKDPKAQKAMVSFFTKGLESVNDPLFSHLLRWDNTRRAKLFFSDQLNAQIGNYDPYQDLLGQLPPEFYGWDYLSKAQYLESSLFLSNYLLSSQGDRVAMGNSVEIRLPFLDYRLIEFMATVPTSWKIFGMEEKYLLKKVFADILPQEILKRPKHPYRAPIVSTLLKSGIDEHNEMLSESAIRNTGLFDPTRVAKLTGKLNASDTASEVDSMALVGILSTQLLHRYYIEKPIAYNDISDKITVFIDKRTTKI